MSYGRRTQAHVLNHCDHNKVRLRERHNHVVDLLKSAATANGWLVVGEDTEFLGQGLRPDLVLTDDRKRSVFIIDVVFPFEGGEIPWRMLAKKNSVNMPCW